MPDLLIDVPDELVAPLAERARKNKRSIEDELRRILIAAAQPFLKDE